MTNIKNKKTAWNRIAGIIYYNDNILYYFDVYLEIYISRFKIPVIIEVIIWISAIFRIMICMFPQNNWCTDEGNMRLSIIRNTVFAITGYRGDHPVFTFRKYLWISYDKDGCSYHYFFWLLSSSNFIQ